MKKQYKTILIGLLVCLPFQSSYALDRDEEILEDSVGYAISLLDGLSTSFQEQKAITILTECAARRDAQAMNALGLAYMQGIGVKQEVDKAIEWLEKAGECGYSRAYQNLGTLYKYARAGVEQDFEKAFYYFRKGVEVGGVSALYDVGYMLYKGLGCTQDYSQAADYFQQGGDRDFPPCMYMLGLCYRNGYGREKDPERARFWLDRAARYNYRAAFDELTNHEAENSYNAPEVFSIDTVTAPRQHRQVNPVTPALDVTGKYHGVLAVYDWSGRHIIAEKMIELELRTQDTIVTGLWKEGNDTVWINAVFKDGVLQFRNTQQKRTDRYLPDEPLWYEFTEAVLETSGSALTGNIRMYSPRTMEPERPMYLSLQKFTAPVKGSKENKSSAESSRMALPGQDAHKLTAYPNPFTGTIQVRFMLEEDASVQVALYTSAGKNVFMSGAQTFAAGEQVVSLTPRVPEGVYILKVFTANRSWQTIVIKKGG